MLTRGARSARDSSLAAVPSSRTRGQTCCLADSLAVVASHAVEARRAPSHTLVPSFWAQSAVGGGRGPARIQVGPCCTLHAAKVAWVSLERSWQTHLTSRRPSADSENVFASRAALRRRISFQPCLAIASNASQVVDGTTRLQLFAGCMSLSEGAQHHCALTSRVISIPDTVKLTFAKFPWITHSNITTTPSRPL